MEEDINRWKRTPSVSAHPRSLSDSALRHEAKEGKSGGVFAEYNEDCSGPGTTQLQAIGRRSKTVIVGQVRNSQPWQLSFLMAEIIY